jgi:type I restriction enzyme R subunit
MVDKKSLSERDICTKYITPALVRAGWDLHSQIREEVSFTKGRIIVRGKLHTRGEQKRADYILYFKSNIPLAVIEAKENNYSVGSGMQQALNYADTLGVPFVFSSNGDGFLMHDRTGLADRIEQELALDAFPSPAQLWQRYCQSKGLESAEARHTIEMPYYDDGTGRVPRYYPGQCHQQHGGSRSEKPAAHFAGHGNRHGQNVHSIPDHLAIVEVRRQEAHLVSG